MRTTIDRAGRVVIPQPIRQRAGLEPGTPLEVTADETGVHLVRAVPRPQLVEENGRLLARPTAPKNARPEIDIAAWIEEERERWP